MNIEQNTKKKKLSRAERNIERYEIIDKPKENEIDWSEYFN